MFAFQVQAFFFAFSKGRYFIMFQTKGGGVVGWQEGDTLMVLLWSCFFFRVREGVREKRGWWLHIVCGVILIRSNCPCWIYFLTSKSISFLPKSFYRHTRWWGFLSSWEYYRHTPLEKLKGDSVVPGPTEGHRPQRRRLGVPQPRLQQLELGQAQRV